ncbi:MAG: cell division protein ZipA C-terminal FtsZ-binding domain-containing protein [Gammaproteobacteria bacterium]
MDKELLRIVIIATGLVVIVCILIWGFIKGKKSRREAALYDDDIVIDESLVVHTGDDDFDIVPLGPARQTTHNRDKSDRYDRAVDDLNIGEEAFDLDDEEPPPRFSVPDIIQFSVVAKTEEGFNGVDLANAFRLAGLEFGTLKIYERLDPNRLVDFGVASMVSPGTFPEDNLESFYCPGIVFFMQPSQLEDASAVFEDYVETIQLVATELEGEIRDHQRQPLTDATVQLIRQSL